MNTIKTAKISNGVKAVLFDIDGVLMDSLEANLKYFQDIFSRAGYRKPTKKAYQKVFHRTFADILGHFVRPHTNPPRRVGVGARSEQKEKLERLHEIGTTMSYPMHLLKATRGARETLRKLAKHYRLGIVSNRRRIGIRRYFTFAKTKRYFNAVVSVEDCKNHKPHPEPLCLAAKRLRVKPSACVYVGDSHIDIEAGRTAGMKTILYGRKKNPDADVSTATFRKLPELIASLKYLT